MKELLFSSIVFSFFSVCASLFFPCLTSIIGSSSDIERRKEEGKLRRFTGGEEGGKQGKEEEEEEMLFFSYKNMGKGKEKKWTRALICPQRKDQDRHRKAKLLCSSTY